MWKNTAKRFLYLSSFYSCLLVCYILLQEFYFENCTIQRGFTNLFMSMPICSYANKILEMLTQQFISLFITIMGIILAIKI
jgi:hypothetical protein